MATTSSLLGTGLGLVLVKFQYEYQGRDGALVSIKPNERYVLLAKTNDHWWQVRSDHNSKPFYIPAKYVKELPADFPSPLDFASPPNPELVSLPVVAPVPVPIPVPVPVPVPKTLEEPSGTKNKLGDEVTIRLRPETSTGYRKTENRMSTFGVPLDFNDLSPLVAPALRHPSNPPAGPTETRTTTITGTTNMADNSLSKKGHVDDHVDSGKHRVPSFSPADPLSTPRTLTQPIPVETPVVPMVPATPPNNNLHSTSSPSTGFHDKHNQEPPIDPEEEEVAEEEMSMEESSGEQDSLKEEDSNHIYESIQDLNLDLEALVGEKISPGAPPEPAPAPPPTQSVLWSRTSDKQSVTEAAPLPGDGAVQWMTWIVYDGQEPVQRPSLCHRCQAVQLCANDRACLPHQAPSFTKSRTCVQGEQDRREHSSLRCSCAAGHSVGPGPTVPQPDILRSASQVVCDPCHQVCDPTTPISVSLSLRSSGWMVLKALEKSKNCNPHSTTASVQVRERSVEQEDDGILHSRLLSSPGKQTAEGQERGGGSVASGAGDGAAAVPWSSSRARRQGDRPEVIQLTRMLGFLGTGMMQDVFHSWGTLSLSQAQEHTLLTPNSPIYANVSSLKKTSVPQISISGPALPSSPPPGPAPLAPDHTPSSSVSSSGMMSPASPVSPQDGWQVHTDLDSGKEFYFHPVTRQTTWSDPRGPPFPPTGDVDRSRGGDGGQLTSPLFSPTSSQGSAGWEQLVNGEVTGRFYYYNPTSGATLWVAPEPLSPSLPTSAPPGPSANRRQDNGPIPRAQLDLKDAGGSQWRLQEGPPLPQRLMGNGVSEEGLTVQVINWRHSVAEDTFALGHRRNVSDFTEVSNRKHSPNSPQCHLLEKAGIINKTKVADNGKKIRKNWSQSWTVLHGGILTFHKDPKFAPAGNATKSSQIVTEYTVELRGASVGWASKDKSSKKNVIELKTRQGCEYLMQYDTESIITDWLKAIQDTIRQLEQDHLSEDEDEVTSDKEDKDRKRTSTRTSSGTADSEQRRVRTKLRRFLQRRPTLQSVKEKGYIRDNVFGCHLDTLCHRENTTIPKFVEKCIRAVERRGLDVDGIYRVSGNLAVIQRLRHKADHEEQLDLEDGQWEEIHVITGALKLFLRELPEPLFPFSCFDTFITAIQVPDYSLRVSYMKDLVRSLPLPNHDTMELLFRHLRKVIEHKESNRMSFQSVAIVFGPTLLRPQTESANMTVHMVFQSQIVELMLKEFQTVFSQK
ncbi:hypothetical protein L3Q82_013773 [Scortum barcoo]|uniref:Uncharacterized protein n=1 Tax=Scortum barcoo TaxID=214431 RepID=A0ACB8VVI4_9TELE|nr:hypothetical protein L3Q82_013773 [Scortum barcoo]